VAALGPGDNRGSKPDTARETTTASHSRRAD
jgi:hypothetical protein